MPRSSVSQEFAAFFNPLTPDCFNAIDLSATVPFPG